MTISRKFLDFLFIFRNNFQQEDEEEWQEPPQATQPDFPDLETKMTLLIERLGGEVFVKLNWSAPKDVSWMLHDNSLCCRTPLDVILLLKGSEFIQHDLTQAFMECGDGCHQTPAGGFILSVRRFQSITPAGEFRCFVRNNNLIAVTQRNHKQFFNTLLPDKVNVLNDIQHFFFSYIQHKFPNPDFVFDVYRASSHHVILVDFNPFCRVTDPLLFSWEEIMTMSPDLSKPIFKVVENQQLIKGHPYATNRVPQDIVNINNQQDINDFVNMFNSGKFNGDSDDDL